MNEAAILAVRGGREVVTLKDVDEAIDRRIAGPAKSSKGMSSHEREVVAYHEAGHAVIGLNLPFSDKVQKITIVPRGRTGGHVLMTPEEDRFLMTKNQLEARIIGYLGGRTSEEIFFGDVSTGAQNDIEVATRIARMMVTEYGMSELGPIQYESNTGSVFLGRDYNSTQRNFSTQIAFEIDTQVRKIIDHAHAEARRILTEKRSQVVAIAQQLLEKETITSEEIQALFVLPKQEETTREPVKKPRKKKEVKGDA
jgi:cell division protease FtsH